MGWYYTDGATKKDIIHERTKEYVDANVRLTTAMHCVRGNCLWMVKEVFSFKTGKFERFIELDLLSGNGAQGWGYKDMEEQMHPYFYSCPLGYLDVTPVTCEKWREGVRAYHAQRAKKVELGATYALKAGCRPDVLKITSVRPLRGINFAGITYRVSKKHLDKKIEDPFKWTPVNHAV